MPRRCPDCKTDMADDSLHAWCENGACDFHGYVVVKTGKILREDPPDWHSGIECEHGHDACPICDA